jgi:glycerophosphoryl diester phosphodiesterase
MTYRPLASAAGVVHVCGHRGHCAGAPENTIPALEAAARHGATVCEIDVVLAKDGEIVLLHDETLDRTTDGRGWVGALTLSEIARLDAGRWFGPEFSGTGIPTLGQALEAARDLGIALHVEIKERRRPDALIDRLSSVLAEAGALEDVLLISFDHPSLVRARARIPGLRTELITHARHVDPVAMARRAGAASVAIEWEMFHPEDAEALHRAGVAVRVTIPSPAKLEELRICGVDAEASILRAVRDGFVDILAGDDVRQVRALVGR